MTDLSASVTRGRVWGADGALVILSCNSSDPVIRVTVRANDYDCYGGSCTSNVASVLMPPRLFEGLRNNAASVCYAVLTIDENDNNSVRSFDFAVRQ